MEPKLSLSYSTRGGPGPAGFGWMIGGLTAIQRGPRNLSDDGEVTGVWLKSTDAFYLDGEKLVRVGNDPSTGVQEFRSRVDSYSRIRAYAWTEQGPSRFVIETRAGLKLFYGASDNSQIRLHGGQTLVWLCDRVEDSVGNFMLYRYATDGIDYRLSEAEYTGNTKLSIAPYAKVLFDYEQVAPYELRYVLGERVEPKFILRRIRSLFRDKILRQYELTQQRVDAFRFSNYLIELKESGADGLSFRPLKFRYSSARSNWQEQKQLTLPVDFSQISGVYAGFRFLDLNGDGRADLVFSASISGTVKSGALLNQPNGWTSSPQWVPPVNLATEAGPNLGVVMHDVDGDGKIDIVVSTDQETGRVYTLGPSGWQVSQGGPPFKFWRKGKPDNRYLFVSTDPSAKQVDSLVWNSPSQGAGAARFTGSGWKKLPTFTPPYAFPIDADGNLNGVYAVDVDCDGQKELVYLTQLPNGQKLSAVYKAQIGGWVEMTDSAYKLPFDPMPNSAAIRFVDLNGDGCMDVVYAYQKGSQRVKEAYLATPKGWIKDPRPLPDFVLWKDNPSETVAEIADLDGDGRADIFWNSSSQSPQRAAFLGKSTGWQADLDLAPPKQLPSKKGERDFSFLVMNLNGDSKREMIYLSSGNSPDVYITTNQGTWAKDQSFSVPLQIAQFDKVDLGVRFMDLNGDGYLDLAYTSLKLDGTVEKKAFIFDPRQPNPWVEDRRFFFPVATFRGELKDTGVSLVDITGDGLTDLLVGFRPGPGQAPQLLAYENCSQKVDCQGKSGDSDFWRLIPAFSPPEPFAEAGTGSLGAKFVDINGDGLTDIVLSRLSKITKIGQPDKFELYSTVYLNTGSGWSKNDQLKPPIEFVRPYWVGSPGFEIAPPDITVRDNQVQLIDLNSDRLPDLLFNFETMEMKTDNFGNSTLQKVIKKGAYLNLGDRWQFVDAYAPPERIDSIDSLPYRQVYFQDVNGDGLPDLIYVDKEGGTQRSVTYLNTGTGWLREPQYDVPLDAVYESNGDQGFRFLDVNGDGLVDVAYHWIAGGKDVLGVYLNTGHGWQKTQDFAPPVAFAEEGRGDVGVRPLDLNGDGIVDFAQSYLRDQNDKRESVFLNLTPKPDLLVNVETGLGVQTFLSYQSALGLDPSTLAPLGVYRPPPSRTSVYPLIDAPLAGYLVTKVTTGGPGILPKASTYRYGENRVDIRSGAPLGFAFQEIRDEAQGRTTTIHYLQTEGLIGSIAETDAIQDGLPAQRISSSVMDWESVVNLGDTTNNGFQPPIYQPLLKKNTRITWDLKGVQLTSEVDSYKYDSLGNTTRVDTDFGDGSSTVTESTYDDDLSRWFIGRLVRATANSSAAGKHSEARVAKFIYDKDTGQLVEEKSLVGTSYELSTKYRRDNFGNKVRIITSAVQTPPERTHKITFDELGRFPIENTDSLGQSSRTIYDPVSGAVLSRINPNGVRVKTEFDSLQRVRAETSPNGTVTRVNTDFPPPDASDSIAFVVARDIPGLPSSRNFYDAEGRIRMGESRGAQGQMVISAYEFDVLGRPVLSSIPHFRGEQTYYSERKYDDLDRITELRQGDGSRVITEYIGLKAVSIDSLGHKAESVRDHRGRVAYTIDAFGHKTEFIYDVQGNLVRTIDALGNITLLSYDIAGQRTGIHNKSLGTWTYKYDGYAQLVSQTDPRGETVRLKYDSMGRLSEKESPSSVCHWAYYDSGNGTGQVSQIDCGTDLVKNFQYDEFGRLFGLEMTAGKDHLEVTQEYDSLGRATRRAYSTGFAIVSSFNKYGYLSQMVGEQNKRSQTLWEAQEYNALGTVVKERLGNGVVSTNTYNPRNGRITDSRSEDANGRPLLDYALKYDEVGNIVERKNLVSGTTESFEYDKLNRLTKSSDRWSGSVSLTYDALGNILSKSDVGTYHYCEDPNKSELLCSVTKPDGKSIVITYDMAGNITGLGKTQISIDDQGRTAYVRETGLNYSRFSYGPEGELVTEETRHGLDKFRSVNLGDTQILREEFAPPVFPTPEKTRVRHFIQSPTGSVGYFEFTYWHFPLEFVSPGYGETQFPIPQRSTELTTGFIYLLQDHLGSIRAMLDERGKVVTRFDYDAWGKRVGQKHDYVYYTMKSGFTGHEELDNVGLIHMGGRVYSPLMARFISPDPMMQAARFSQAYNRYGYVLNNPLRLVDPNGFDFWGDAWGWVTDTFWNKPTKWGQEQLQKAGRWLQENWRTVVVIAVSVAMAAVGIPPVLIGALAGGLNAGLYGGSLADIVKGALIGAVTGQAYASIAASASGLTAAVASGGVGAWSAGAQGGNPVLGFFSAFAAGALAPLSKTLPSGYRVAAASVAGGTVSAIGGGSFENGAITGAFAELFSEIGEEARTRTLTGAEKDRARAYLLSLHSDDPGFNESSLNFLDSVKVINGDFMFFQPDGRPMSPNGNIYWPGFTPDDFTKAGPEDFGTFTHEMEHVYEYNQGESILYKGMLLHVFGPSDPYAFPLHEPYGNLNLEQRAEVLRYRFFPKQFDIRNGVVTGNGRFWEW
jgi:RHS repeat-associated protein